MPIELYPQSIQFQTRRSPILLLGPCLNGLIDNSRRPALAGSVSASQSPRFGNRKDEGRAPVPRNDTPALVEEEAPMSLTSLSLKSPGSNSGCRQTLRSSFLAAVGGWRAGERARTVAGRLTGGPQIQVQDSVWSVRSNAFCGHAWRWMEIEPLAGLGILEKCGS